jgi:hypothetical protein
MIASDIKEMEIGRLQFQLENPLHLGGTLDRQGDPLLGREFQVVAVDVDLVRIITPGVALELSIDQFLWRVLHQVTKQESDVMTAKLHDEISQSDIMALGTVGPSDHGPSHAT